MEWFWQSDINITLWIQSLGGWLELPMTIISMLGTQEFFMIALPAILWCWNYSLGIQIGIILLLEGGINTTLKFIFQAPRPYWIDAGVKAYAGETSFGFPSGHTQISTGVWGIFGLELVKKGIILFSIIAIALIGFSRIYLGVHFVEDVLGGLVFGLLVLILVRKYDTPILKWLNTRDIYQKYSLAVFSTAIFLFLMLLPFIFGKDFQIPGAWARQAQISYPSLQIDPFNQEHVFTVAGTWFGLVMGFIWFNQKYGSFKVEGSAKQKLLRYLVGVVGIFVIWFGLGRLFPEQPVYLGWIFRFIRYGLLGLWISVIAPLIFHRLKLAKA
jgi:membrane-associated phospholipid phosphatase